jgi:hypothetical protein
MRPRAQKPVGQQSRSHREFVRSRQWQEDEYESVDCPACEKVNFINRKSRKLWAEKTVATNS